MLQELFSTAAVNHHSKVAVIDRERRITFGGLQEAALEFAAQLRTLGSRTGDRVASPLPNGIESAIALWGTLEAGAAFVPLHASLKEDGRQHILADADPQWIAHPGGTITRRDCKKDEKTAGLAALIYTSGSTGEPKGVMLDHANMQAAAHMVSGYLRLSSDDIIHSALPLSSSYGLYQLILGLAAGATVLLDRGFAFPASCLALMERERASVLAAVPAMLGWMAHSPVLERYDLSSLRTITSAAAALPPAHALRVQQRLPQAKLFVMYGQTECKRISYLPPEELDASADSVGRGLLGQEHKVVDTSGDRVPAGEVGELVVRGPHVMRGYWRNPAETAAKLRTIGTDPDPWLFTGDAFTEDGAGLLRFAGRKDEMLKVGGHKVSPVEIENLICRIPGVLEVAVLGIPDPRLGMVPAAFVVRTPESSLTEDEVRRYCSQRLRGHLVPRLIRFRQSLPKSPAGKTMKLAIEIDSGEVEKLST